MKNSFLATLWTLCSSLGLILAQGNPSPSAKEVQHEVDLRLKTGLNPEITFDNSLKDEAETWLHLKIQDKSTEGRIGEGKVHLFGHLKASETLGISSVLSYIDLNNERLKNGVFNYWQNAGTGFPSAYYCDVLEIEGKKYFLYALR